MRRLKEKGRAVSGNEGQIRANREKALFSHMWNFARERGFTANANPCAGVRNYKETGRSIYIEDETYQAVLSAADEAIRNVMEMAYLTGQRSADVLKLSLADVREGAVWVQQNKTKHRLRISLEGELAVLVNKLTLRRRVTGKVQSLLLLVKENGEPFSPNMLRSGFDKARMKAATKARSVGNEKRALAIEAFQFRDLRAKAGTDKEEISGMAAAKDQLGHANESMTNGYVRHRKGKLVTPTK